MKETSFGHFDVEAFEERLERASSEDSRLELETDRIVEEKNPKRPILNIPFKEAYPITKSTREILSEYNICPIPFERTVGFVEDERGYLEGNGQEEDMPYQVVRVRFSKKVRLKDGAQIMKRSVIEIHARKLGTSVEVERRDYVQRRFFGWEKADFSKEVPSHWFY